MFKEYTKKPLPKEGYTPTDYFNDIFTCQLPPLSTTSPITTTTKTTAKSTTTPAKSTTTPGKHTTTKTTKSTTTTTKPTTTTTKWYTTTASTVSGDLTCVSDEKVVAKVIQTLLKIKFRWLIFYSNQQSMKSTDINHFSVCKAFSRKNFP